MAVSWKIFIKWTVVGVAGLTLFYFLVSSIVGRSIIHPFDQFNSLQPWISILILSFGIQTGLFKLIHSNPRLIGTTGAVNGGAMIACCAHHASDILPILGASGLSLILTTYQKDFLILGVAINFFTVFYLLRFLNFERAKIFKYSFLTFAIITTFFGIFSAINDIFVQISSSTDAKEIKLTSQTKQLGLVGVEVIPKQLSHGKKSIFTVQLNNHSIDLNYDYTKIAILVDSEGNIYKPLSWSGGEGGHHVSGDLVFDKLSNKAESVGLNIMGIDNQKAVFGWKL